MPPAQVRTSIRWAGLKAQLGTTLATEIIAFVSSMLFSIVVTRALQPSGKGMFSAAMSSIGVASAAASFGFGKSLMYFLNQRDRKRASVTGAVSWFFPVMVLVSAVVLKLLLPSGLTGHRTTLAIAVLIAALMLATGLVESALRAVRQIHVANAASAAGSIGQLALAGVFLGSVTMSADLALTVVLLAGVIRMLVLLVRLREQPDLRPSAQLSGPTLKALLAYGVTYQVYSLIWALQCRGDVLLMQWLRGPEDTGIYSTGANLAQLLWRLPTAIMFVTIPLMTQMRKSKEAAEFTALSIRLTLVVLVAAAVGLAVMARPLVLLFYGQSFLPSVLPLLVLLPGSVAAALYLLATASLVARGDLLPIVKVAVATLALNITINVLLIPRYGPAGAAFSSTVSYTISFLLAARYLVRTQGVRFSELFLLTRRDIARVFSARERPSL